MGFHDTLNGPTDMHGPYAQVFANAAARTGDTAVYTSAQSTAGGSSNPIKAFQTDTNEEYVLTNHSPTTWTLVNGGGGGGEANIGANVGGGAGNVYQGKSGSTLNFRTFVATGSATVTQVGDTIEVGAPAGAGEANLGANVGTGGAGTAGVFRDKTSVTLNFRRLVQQGLISVTENGDDIELDTTAEANTAANVGGGSGVFRDKIGSALNFRSLVQGASMLLTQAADTITVALGTLTATLNSGNQDITAIKTATFQAEFDNGNSGASDTINFGTGQKQRSTLTANTTLTLNAPPGPCNLMLRLIQDATGGRTVTWVAGTGVSAIRWPSSTAPAVSNGGANAIHVVAFYYDGTDLYGVGSLSFG